MHRRIMSFPSPTLILPHADHSWSSKRHRSFYGNSFTAPTPSISTLQQLGLCISKSFASHVWYASTKFCDHPTVNTPCHHVSVTVPTYADHTRYDPNLNRGCLYSLHFNSYNPNFRMVFIYVDLFFSLFPSMYFCEFLPTTAQGGNRFQKTI